MAAGSAVTVSALSTVSFGDVLPAWNDQNLISLARQVKTRLVLAHVRVAKL
jgi:predicted glutamine amidotransferase